jgi:Transposase DDE domain
MEKSKIGSGSGGFEFPRVYRENKNKIKRLITSEGKQDLVEFSKWSSADDFMNYVLESNFLEFADKTYPTPRRKTEVPVWFLISAQLVMRLFNGTKYRDLNTFLKSGSVLSRVGFNVVEAKGFNEKNSYERYIPCHQDTVRKFFKDTSRSELKEWFCGEVQEWFLKNEGIDPEGVFILDQSHVVVPENDNYKDAKLMPVDEHGQLYKGSKEEIEKYKWHWCYTLSALFHINPNRGYYNYTGYEFGAGNEDELKQAEEILQRYVTANGKGVIKLLIVDRGYISGEFINTCKGKFEIDVLIPLRSNMTQYQDAIELSKDAGTKWESLSDPEEMNLKEQGKAFKMVSGCTVKNNTLWDTCNHELAVTVIREEEGDNYQVKEIHYFLLASTKSFLSPFQVRQTYRLRTRVEEGFRQLKHAWSITEFPSPNSALLETQIVFTLLVYSLLNCYLRKTKQHDAVTNFVSTIRKQAQENADDKMIVAYAEDSFGLFGIKEYLGLICDLKEEQKQRYMMSLNGVNQR